MRKLAVLLTIVCNACGAYEVDRSIVDYAAARVEDAFLAKLDTAVDMGALLEEHPVIVVLGAAQGFDGNYQAGSPSVLLVNQVDDFDFDSCYESRYWVAHEMLHHVCRVLELCTHEQSMEHEVPGVFFHYNYVRDLPLLDTVESQVSVETKRYCLDKYEPYGPRE